MPLELAFAILELHTVGGQILQILSPWNGGKMGECEIGGGSESLALKDLVCFGSSDMCFWHLS